MLELNQCYNMDCMKGMAQFPDGFFDLAVVDPPYFSGPERRGYYGSKVSKIGVHRDYPVSPVWEIPGRAYFDELPEMEGKEQVGAVLDIDSKAWEKMFFDEKYAETAGAAFGVNLTDADPLEQEARRVPLEMFYKGMGLVGLMYGNAGELIFYDSALIAPIADVVKNSDYIQTVVRKTAGGAPYRKVAENGDEAARDRGQAARSCFDYLPGVEARRV